MKILSITVLMIILLGTTACVNTPYNYLKKGDYDGLKKRVLEDKSFIKRKKCSNYQEDYYYCLKYNYFTITDYLAMYNFINETEDAKLLDFLLTNGAPVTNKYYTKYYTEPLYRALKSRRNKIAKVIIKHQEKTSDKTFLDNLTYQKDSALMATVRQRNNEEIIEYLISKNANINKLNVYGISPLELALSIPNNSVNINTLLKNKAIYKLKGKLPFNYENLSNLKILAKYGISALDDNSFVYYTYKQDEQNILNKTEREYLKDIKADFTLEGIDYLRKIHLLILSKDNDFFKKSVYLCLKNNKDCAKYLDSFTSFGFSPLAITAFYNNYDLMEFLLKNGANPNRQNKFSQTPLHLAILLKNKTAIKLLLKYNADITIKDIKNNSPKDLYQKLFNKKISNLEIK